MDTPLVDVAVDCVDDAVTVGKLLLSGNPLPGIGVVLFRSLVLFTSSLQEPRASSSSTHRA